MLTACLTCLLRLSLPSEVMNYEFVRWHFFYNFLRKKLSIWASNKNWWSMASEDLKERIVYMRTKSFMWQSWTTRSLILAGNSQCYSECEPIPTVNSLIKGMINVLFNKIVLITHLKNYFEYLGASFVTYIFNIEGKFPNFKFIFA